MPPKYELWADALKIPSVHSEESLIRIFWPISEGNSRRRRNNEEFYFLLEDVTIIRKVKFGGLGRASYVVRINLTVLAEHLFLYKPHAERKVGKPKLKWEDGVFWEMRKIGIRNWKTDGMNRDNWQSLLQLHDQACNDPHDDDRRNRFYIIVFRMRT